MLKPAQIRELSNAEWRQNNPNYNNYYGSTTTTFDGDQATVNQQYSEPVQQLVDQRMAFLSGGPQQMQAFSNPFMEQMIGAQSNRVAQRAGQPKPMGSINNTPQPANPQLSFGYGQELPTVGPPSPGQSSEEQGGIGSRIVPALDVVSRGLPTSVEPQPGGGYGGRGASDQLTTLLDALQQRQRRRQQDYEFRGL